MSNGNVSLEKLAAEAAGIFERKFGKVPDCVAAAPGRVNLIGGHVDYNDGIVLPLAIDRYTVVAGGKSSSPGRARFYSVQFDKSFEIDLTQPIKPDEKSWSNYVAGVVAGFLDVRDCQGFEAIIHSSVPCGGGVSSSAALEVATATFLEGCCGSGLNKIEKALLCQQAERTFAGMPCGIMDQFASVFGEERNAIRLDCRTLEFELIPWDAKKITVLIVNSLAPHRLVDGEYAARRQQSAAALEKLNLGSYRELTLAWLESKRQLLTDTEFKRARHVVTEIERTKTAAEAVEQSDWVRAGKQLFGSHDSLRDDYQVSCRELDLLVEIAHGIGVEAGMYGMRMTGGGFGGCTVSIVETRSLSQIIARIQKDYAAETGIAPIVFSTLPARGAHLLKS